MRLRSIFAPAFFVASLTLALIGCSQQSEGERCDLKNGNDDCADGLTCISKQVLGSSSDICCPPNSTDLSCIPGGLGTTTSSESTTATTTTTTSSSTASGGAGGTGGGGGGGGGGTGGGGGIGGTTTST
jgi:hypothetical protein